jgi:stage V sporulation protein D (sporulation-specific penicillin-binding protein)
MDPRTGEILANANIPDYDLNNPPREDVSLLNELSRNKIITDVYEPGSTFKVMTAAAVLDSGLMSTETTTFDCSGSNIVDGQMIKCWRFPRGHGHQTFHEAVQNSCNVAFMKMGLAMGTEKFYDYIYNFGFGQNTGITFPSDQGGIVMAEKYVTSRDLARIAFGQSIAVTPLQLITSVSAVVNGGFLFKPSIVKDIEDNEGNIIKSFEPEVVTQPISAETSAIMRDVLESVVSKGSGKNCYIPGYRVGGKTGTAQKYDKNHQVMTGSHIASFIGFAPADDPQIVVLIIVDEPQVAVDFGSVVAAPYVKDVLLNSLQYFKIEPDLTAAGVPEQVTVPEVSHLEAAQAADALEDAGLDCLMDGTGKVISQMPAPGTVVDEGTTVLLYMETKNIGEDTTGMVVVPDLSGLTIMEAGKMLEVFKLQLGIQGEGVAGYQSPAAGELVPEGTKVLVEFQKPGG